MLPKHSRLSSREVDEVLKKGLSFKISPTRGGNSLISLKFLPVSGGFKAAAVVPKAIAKSAVVRNRIRRAVYRAIANLPTPKRSGIAVFFVRHIPKGPLTPAFEEEINAFFQKI